MSDWRENDHLVSAARHFALSRRELRRFRENVTSIPRSLYRLARIRIGR